MTLNHFERLPILSWPVGNPLPKVSVLELFKHDPGTEEDGLDEVR